VVITIDYQQRVICSGSEIISDGSLEPLRMIFSIIVWPPFYRGRGGWSGREMDQCHRFYAAQCAGYESGSGRGEATGPSHLW
jgi:hypothetical protein